ncbi:MAG: HlyD family efflux transporter periplasmic adaptor subunit [Chitinophagaceae bacterium]|nr:HlyD family efflux transporter periplasmic adaptor subunit [Chitinophagaceae bacterium]
MGELQQNYQQFMNAYQEFKDYLGEGFYIRKKCLLGLDTVYLSKAQESLQQQKELLLKDLSLSEETYKVNQSLFDSKVISKQDHRVEQSKLLNKKITIPQVNSQILNNQSQMRDKRKEIFDLDHTISKQQDVFLQSAQVFKSQLNEWDKKYIIRAPINGKLILFAMAQAKHFSKTGTLLGYINPPKSEYYAEANLSQYNFGKIEVGQKVQLRFDAYPFQEFGFVTGSIGYVSDISLDSGFLTRINITDGLVTSSHKSLRYRDGLKAEAQIVTKDMRLSERFYYNIVSSLKQ